jgi:hypothetical protein
VNEPRHQLKAPGVSYQWPARALVALIGFVIAPCCHAQSGPVQGSRASSEAQGMAAYLWKTIATTCAVNGAAPSSVFIRHSRELYEYREAQTGLYPWRLTKADELNGTQFKGLAVLRAPAHRSIASKRAWTPWVAAAKEATNMTAEWFAEGPYETHRGYSAWWPDIWVVLIEQRNNEWSFTFPQFAGVNKWNHPLNREALSEAAGQKEPCDILTSSDPFGLQSQ